jgi:hypothetical protein
VTDGFYFVTITSYSSIAVTSAVSGAIGKTSTNLLFVLHHFRNGRFVLAIQPANLRLRFCFYFNHIQNIHFLTSGKGIMASLRLRSTTSITTLKLWGHYCGKWGIANTNSAIRRQLMPTARTLATEWRQVLRGSVGTGTKEDESSTGRVWAAGFHHFRACSRLAYVFETYEQFISLIFQFFRAVDTE